METIFEAKIGAIIECVDEHERLGSTPAETAEIIRERTGEMQIDSHEIQVAANRLKNATYLTQPFATEVAALIA